MHYYYVLRSVLVSKPELRKYLTRCRHCSIYFLTDPRNKGRTDLGCPFGCGQAHRKERGKIRSTEYYQTPWGKGKKKIINDRRSAKEQSLNSAEDATEEQRYYKVGQMSLDEDTVNYLETVTSLIEERRVGKEEILSMLKAKMRQHSMVKMKRIEYILRYHLGKPP